MPRHAFANALLIAFVAGSALAPGAMAAEPAPVTAPPTSAVIAGLPGSSQLLRALVAANRERVDAGLRPLAWSSALAAVAYAHSRDMATRDFFEHTNPDGQSPFDRMIAAGIDFMAAGENIAYNGSGNGEAVIQQWMHSPGHRANLLSYHFGKVGMGVAVSADGRYYWTQDFSN